MHIATSSKDLAAGLAIAKKGLPTREFAIPVLAGVHIATGADHVVLTATDLADMVRVTVPAVVHRPGVGIVGARLLDQLARGADARQPVQLEVDGPDATFTDADTSSTIRALPVDEFPTIRRAPATAALPLDVAAVASVITAASTAADLPVVGAVYFDGRVIAATDRYRLHVVVLPEPHGFTRLLVPAGSLAHALTLTDPTMRVGPTEVWIEAGPVQWVVRNDHLDAGAYPPFHPLLAQGLTKLVAVDPHALRRAVQKVQVMGDATAPVTLTVTSASIVAEVRGIDGTTRSNPVPVVDQAAASPLGAIAEEFEGRYNPAYLARVLEYPRDVETVDLAVHEPRKPIMFAHRDNDGRRHQRVLVPTR